MFKLVPGPIYPVLIDALLESGFDPIPSAWSKKI
jgi:hypothetical protein